jgi:hypothetical protein
MVPGGIARWLPVVAVSISALPVGLVVARALERRAVRRGVEVDRARRWSLAEVGMVAGTLPWLWMILTPLPAAREVRLIPFVDLTDLLAGSPVTAFFQIGGNLLVFAAFGFCARIRWRISPVVITALAAMGSITVETLQYLLALGRVSSVDDVLLNAAGAGLAALAGRRARIFSEPDTLLRISGNDPVQSPGADLRRSRYGHRYGVLRGRRI